jgi:sulfite exporter TauE/SafE
MLKTLIEGFLLGLSTGSICLLTCTPIYLPYLVSEERSLKKSFLKILEISGGRFFAYLIFGAAAGYLGSFMPHQQRTLFTGISYILLSIFLTLNALRTHKAEKHCKIPVWTKFTNSAFMLGIVTGIHFCPSFLIALTKSVDLGGPLGGALLFLGFFAGTTIFLIPLAFSGLLTVIGSVKTAARFASVLIAIWFFWQGGVNIYKAWQDKQAVVISPMEAKFKAFIITSPQDSLYAKALSDSLSKVYPEPPKVIIYTVLNPQALYFSPDFTVLYITASLWKTQYEKDLAKNNYVIIPAGFSIPQAINFLKTYDFKVKKDVGFHWSFEEKKAK